MRDSALDPRIPREADNGVFEHLSGLSGLIDFRRASHSWAR